MRSWRSAGLVVQRQPHAGHALLVEAHHIIELIGGDWDRERFEFGGGGGDLEGSRRGVRVGWVIKWGGMNGGAGEGRYLDRNAKFVKDGDAVFIEKNSAFNGRALVFPFHRSSFHQWAALCFQRCVSQSLLAVLALVATAAHSSS